MGLDQRVPARGLSPQFPARTNQRALVAIPFREPTQPSSSQNRPAAGADHRGGRPPAGLPVPIAAQLRSPIRASSSSESSTTPPGCGTARSTLGRGFHRRLSPARSHAAARACSAASLTSASRRGQDCPGSTRRPPHQPGRPEAPYCERKMKMDLIGVQLANGLVGPSCRAGRGWCSDAAASDGLGRLAMGSSR